jgi:protein TonB
METIARRNWVTWLFALTGAMVLNILLFAMMPYLLRPAQSPPEFNEYISQVNVVRIKRPETPVKKVIEKKEPEKPEKITAQKSPEMARPRMRKLSLPFEINPRLPSAPNTIALPETPPPTFEISNLTDVFSGGDLDAPLMVLSRIPPVYPLKAKHRGIEGWVRVRIVIKEDGTVGKVTIMESNPSDIFDQSVIQCVSKWRFKPGTVEGIAVKTVAETTIHFELN